MIFKHGWRKILNREGDVMPGRMILLFFLTLLILLIIYGCDKQAANPEETRPFVGGLENPASDGSYTEKIYSENGIASLEEVTLGDEKQWILIRGYDVSKPVLIFLHGGPGSACIFYTTYAMGGIENDFVVVTWDQRGSGKSYHENINPNSLTFEQLYSDTHELIVKIMERFEVDKIYLMGISWGSILGSNIAKDFPDLLHAYIGIGQVVDAARGLEIALQTVLNKANELSNQSAITELSNIHPDSTWDHNEIISKWVEAFGFGDFHNEVRATQIRESLSSSLTEYTSQDIMNLDKGKELYSLSPLGSDLTWLKNLNMIIQIPSYEIPVYFLSGKFDYKTPSQLVEEYYQSLNTLAGKRMIWFENSAHVPILEEREVFHDTMTNIVLAETNPGDSI
jgi:pimeloyl-ACP methyl ester carboxylesterase